MWGKKAGFIVSFKKK